MNWDIDNIEPGYLPDNRRELKLCRASLCFIYGLSRNHIKKVSEKMRKDNSSDITSIKYVKPYDHRSYFGDDYSMENIQAIFDGAGLDVSIAEERASLLRASDKYVECYLWMETYFYRFESQPNATEIHVDSTFKRSIWEEYCQAKLSTEGRLSEVRISYMYVHIF